jgi:hypothetical protein
LVRVGLIHFRICLFSSFSVNHRRDKSRSVFFWVHGADIFWDIRYNLSSPFSMAVQLALHQVRSQLCTLHGVRYAGSCTAS